MRLSVLCAVELADGGVARQSNGSDLSERGREENGESDDEIRKAKVRQMRADADETENADADERALR